MSGSHRKLNTVVLVHGVTFSPRCMDFMSRYLARRGWKVLRPALTPGNGSAPIEELSAMLAEFIRANTLPDERIDLVGFSMGGLVCRYYLQFLSGAARTDRFISIATPHLGTKMACLLPGAGMKQMRPGSEFLRMLNSDMSALQSLACTVMYTPMDMVIIPARSAIMSFAHVVRFALPGHPLMIYHPAVFKKLAKVLSLPGKKNTPML